MPSLPLLTILHTYYGVAWYNVCPTSVPQCSVQCIHVYVYTCERVYCSSCGSTAKPKAANDHLFSEI